MRWEDWSTRRNNKMATKGGCGTNIDKVDEWGNMDWVRVGNMTVSPQRPAGRPLVPHKHQSYVCITN